MKDVMYSSFIVSPTTSVVTSMKLDRSNWQRFISRTQYTIGSNIDALNQSVGEMKKTLNMQDYKADIYLTMLPIRESVTDFGVVNGKNLDLSKIEDQILAIKWSIDEQISQFNSHNYKNLNLAGFYWFDESIDKVKQITTVKNVNTYIHSLGYISIWIPYYKAQGYKDWKTFCFDYSFMQANYFPDNPSNPNAGGIERLPSVTSLINMANMGVCVEMNGSASKIDVTALKRYLLEGCGTPGFMKKKVAYYTAGVDAIYKMANSNDLYIRSGYDDLYLFINDSISKDLINICE